MRRDLKANLDVVQSIVPQVVTGDVSGVGADLRGFDGALLVVNAGAIVGAGVVLPIAEDSDDSTNGSDGTWGAVAAGELLGAFVNCVASTPQRVGYIGVKRWVRVRADHVSGTSVAVAASVVRGLPSVKPLA